MINSYNDSFIKKFNGEEQVKSYTDTFVNKANSDDETGNYNRFFVNNTDSNEVGSEYKNPFLNNADNINRNNNYVKSFVNDYNNQEQNHINNNSDFNRFNNTVTSSDLSSGRKYESSRAFMNSSDNFNSAHNNFNSYIENDKFGNSELGSNSSGYLNNNSGFIKAEDAYNFNNDVEINNSGVDINNNPLMNIKEHNIFDNNENNLQENYNAPFGTEEDKIQGKYIRSFMKDNNQQSSRFETEDFIVKNEEIDKELNLNTQNFEGGNNNFSQIKKETKINEHIKDFEGEFNNNNLDKYKNITFPSKLKEDNQSSYNQKFERNESNIESIENNTNNNMEFNNSISNTNNNMEFNNSISNTNSTEFNTTFKVKAIQEGEKGSYNKYFGNDDSKGDTSMYSNGEERVDFTKIFAEENSNTIESDMTYEEMDEILNRYRANNDKDNNNYYFDQSRENNKFFSKFLNQNNEDEHGDYSNNNIDDYEDFTEDYNGKVYKGYSKPSWYNPDAIEKRRANNEFFSKYFNNSQDINDEQINSNYVNESEDNSSYEKLDSMLRKYREEESNEDYVNISNFNNYENSYKNIYNENGYGHKENNTAGENQLDYFNNEYRNSSYNRYEDKYLYNSTRNDDRRNKINYPKKSGLNNSTEFNNTNDFKTLNTLGNQAILQLNNRLDNVHEHNYLGFNSMSTKVTRGGFNIVSTDFSNDTINFPSSGIYRVEINIEYNFIVTDYIAGKDYQMVFTLEDANKNPIFTMNKVAPTSSGSTYIANNIRNSELIEVKNLPYSLKLKLNNFSFSSSVPLDISSLGVSIVKISD